MLAVAAPGDRALEFGPVAETMSVPPLARLAMRGDYAVIA
jgi:hypothetical protein